LKLEEAHVVEQRAIQGGYRLLTLEAPGIAPHIRPGQFVHLRVPRLEDAVLRRPFSVFRTDGTALELLYKAVGRGTLAMQALAAGDRVSLIGPLGNGYPAPAPGALPVLVAGGYGMAALYLLARSSPAKGQAFVGGAGAPDILCVPAFEQLGWTVHVATEDGSQGLKGLVTDALDRWLARAGAQRPLEFFACGPNGMLQAVGARAQQGGWKAWLSMDRHMGCGVGACLTCVQKVRLPGGDWDRVRVCREGPVFECRDIIWEEME